MNTKSDCLNKQLPTLILLAAFLFCSRQGFCLKPAGKTRLFEEEIKIYRGEGLRLQRQGDIKGAISCFQKALAIDPANALIFNDLGISYEAVGAAKRAEEMYLRAIELSPYVLESYTNLALLYETKGDYPRAVLYWMKRLTMGTSGDPWTEKARLRLEGIINSHPEEFNKVMMPAVSRSSNNPAAAGRNISTQQMPPVSNYPRPNMPSEQTLSNNQKAALAHLESAQQSFAKGEYVNALKEATTAEYLDASNPEVRTFVAQVREALLH
jgi:tetratricopeptide (TPR) repeat protein